MSRLRPFNRDLRSDPDETEPAQSYEEPSYMDQVADEFHSRLNRRNVHGGSFWRTNTSSNNPPENLTTMVSSPEIGNRSSSGLLRGSTGASVGTSVASSTGTDTVESPQGKVRRSLYAQISAVFRFCSTESLTFSQQDSARRESYTSFSSIASRDTKKRESSIQRASERRRKQEFQSPVEYVEDSISLHGEEDYNDAEDDDSDGFTDLPPPPPPMPSTNPLHRSSSDQSTGSLLYGSASNSAHISKGSSLIFPTGIDEAGNNIEDDKRRAINLRLDQCESARFRFKKRLMLDDLNLTASDIPLSYLCGTSLGQSLHKLSLAGNRLGIVPDNLVVSLPSLRSLDLSQCELHRLPDKWDLPQLHRLNLRHNLLVDFPEETMLKGLPELQELDLYANKVAEIVIPRGNALSKLEVLDLGYNDLAYIPDDLDQLKCLKTLRIMNNYVGKIPMRVCEMDLRVIDVSSNPLTQPPVETCERGIASMKRYYHCLMREEQTKKEEYPADAANKIKSGKKPYGRFTKSLGRRPSSQSSETEDVPVSFLPRPVSENHAYRSESDPAHTPEPHNAIAERSIIVSSKSESEIPTELNISMSVPEVLVPQHPPEKVVVNDTLKVIFVGMAMVGKTSMIKRLIKGQNAIIPTQDERTIGVDIYEWDPKKDKRFEHINTNIAIYDSELRDACGEVDVKFSVWDFAGQHVYHATHELFFSQRALYVLVWDMGVTNRKTMKQTERVYEEDDAFAMGLDVLGSDDEGDDDSDLGLTEEDEQLRADRELEIDIDEKVQFWIDCIQSSAPGAAILPVASYADFFKSEGGDKEAIRRCSILKRRLIRHEENRIQGLNDRLKEYYDTNRADDPAAQRLRNLLGSFKTPKLIFGDSDEDCVVRVSGTEYSGFEKLTEKIVGIATGRVKAGWYPVFHGHVGARIPRMRLQIREVVRKIRSKNLVMEWEHFVDELRQHGLQTIENTEDIVDALHFLAKIGELSYFGDTKEGTDEGKNVSSSSRRPSSRIKSSKHRDESFVQDSVEEMSYDSDGYDDDDFDEDDNAVFSMDETSITLATSGGSVASVDDYLASGLSQYIFLNPRWLLAAVACILRHDLDREIRDAHRRQNLVKGHVPVPTFNFQNAQLNCPVITAEDACLLWKNKKITKFFGKRAKEKSKAPWSPLEFLQHLLVRFGIFVPIDLTITRALFGGRDFSNATVRVGEEEQSIQERAANSRFYFLPSLLGSTEPDDIWTFKTTDAWKSTLCHSLLFPDGVPPGLMERFTAMVLSSIYSLAKRTPGTPGETSTERLNVKEVLCWRTAFFLKLGTTTSTGEDTARESIVEIFANIVDRESPLCVGAMDMGVGMRRLLISGRGQVGDYGRKIWDGGYLLVLKCAQRVMNDYSGAEFEKHAFCPECLAKKPISEACYWDIQVIKNMATMSDGTAHCRNGHLVDVDLVTGPHGSTQKRRQSRSVPGGAAVPVQNLLHAVVVVGLWNSDTREVVRVGSGFIVDRKQGLIVTASHTLMNISSDRNFGENYYGLRNGKVVIGLIPRENESERASGREKAVFRYFAKIVAKDPKIEDGECNIDACVLRITTRMENDVGGNGEGCGDQPEKLLLNNPDALKNEKLKALKITDKCELDEQVRIIGYNQGGEGLMMPGRQVSRDVDFLRGYVSKIFNPGEQQVVSPKNRDRFKPRQEIVVQSYSIGGHSGGPCVNQNGEVIGILSRADPAENSRCYICPTSEWKRLVKKAKVTL